MLESKNVKKIMQKIITQSEDLSLVPHGNLDIADEISYNRMEEAERLALLCRNDYICLARDPAIAYDPAKEILDIQIGYSDKGYLMVKLPFLLPKREWKDRRYIDDVFGDSVVKFVFKTRRRLPDPCVILFRYGYKDKTHMRDYDNMESKSVIDYILKCLVHDDAPWCCETHYCAVPAEEWFTEVFVMSRQQYKEWVNEEMI